VYNFPEPSERTVVWLGQHTLHDAEHHLLDIETVISKSQ
jgi:S-DNA-T family DNA segregation ATPase FtsK/SpoIIIE